MTYRQNYVIYAVPYQLPETHEWIAKVNIGCDRGADRRIDQYTDEESRFATRDEAIARCFEFGRRVIDEELAEDGNG